jgi:hypothetical protein
MKSRKRDARNYEVLRHEKAILHAATAEQQRRVINGMSAEDLAHYDADFENWAHANQLPPNGEGWRVWLMMAGRGFGKTRAGAEWIYRLASGRAGVQVALVGASIADARTIMVEGVSGLLSIARRHRRRLNWEPSLGRLKWPNGSQAQLFSGDHADGLRGPEHDFAWFLTFELDADDGPPSLGSLLTDASRLAISCDDPRPLPGFAAYGGSIRGAVEPLVDSFGVSLFDDGVTLRQPATDVLSAIGLQELGNSSDGEVRPRVEREQLPARSAPTTLRLTYYDPERDYQSGEARGVLGEQSGNEVQRELPAVLTAAAAKSLAQEILARGWANRDKLTLRLPPGRLALEPGAGIELTLSPSQWIVEKTIIEGFVVVAELRPAATISATVCGDGGRIVPNSDVVSGLVVLALIDVPNVLGSSNEPTVLLAASTATLGWKPRAVAISFAGQEISAVTARGKSLLGHSTTQLAAAETDLVDEQNSLEVQMIDADQWLTSCDDDALAAGENFAVLGSELIQFGEVTPVGEGKFRLDRLLRGRGGTEWACGLHVAGESFCVLRLGTVQPIVLPSWSLGATVSATTAGGSGAPIQFAGEALRPPSPVNLVVDQQADGGLLLQWTRRSRQGFAWVDGIDAPLGETREQYRVAVTGSSGSIELDLDQPLAAVAAALVDTLGVGPATVEVRQIGDRGASRPAVLTTNLS